MNICFISPKQSDEDTLNIKLLLSNDDKNKIYHTNYMDFNKQYAYIGNSDILVADVSQASYYTFLLLGVWYGCHQNKCEIILFTNNKRNLMLEWIPDEFNCKIAKSYADLIRELGELENGKIV